jgi:hypothetical protein
MAQVKLMSRIYNQAALVHIWLGPEDRSTKTGIETLRKLLAYHVTKWKGLESNADPDLLMWWRLKSEKVLPKAVSLYVESELVEIPTDEYKWKITPDEFDAFESLIQRRWFQRVWIVQELARAKQLQMSCGMQSIVWEDLFRVLTILNPARDVFRKGPYVWQTSEGSTAFVCAEVRGRINPSEASDYGLRNMSKIAVWSEKSRLPLAALLLQTWHFKATDPHDKVYALLGLAKDWNQSHSIQPDYNKPVADLFTEVAQIMLEGFEEIDDIREDQDEYTVNANSGGIPSLDPLEILVFASGDKGMRPALPSWVPEFGKSVHSPRLWHPEYHPYPPELGKVGSWSFPKLGVLQTRGTINEVIAQTEVRKPGVPPDDLERFIQWLHLFANIEEPDDDVFLTMWACGSVFRFTSRFSFSSVETRDAFVAFMSFCARKRILFEDTAVQSEANYLNWRDNWTRLREAKDGHVLPPIADLESELEDAEYRAKLEGMSIRDVSYDQRAFLVSLRHYTETRVFFRAESGNLGIAPADTRMGDSICTIGGACTTFVIRRSQEDPGMWKLVGEACMPFVRRSSDVVDLCFQ